jgi:ribonuclease J
VHKGNALVHVSGHASAGELLYLYNIVKPRNVMPVHGEWRHLRANAALARATGVPESHVIVAEDGTMVDLHAGVATVVGAVPVRYVYVDGSGVGDISEASLKDRRVLGEEGFISIFVVVHAAERRIAVAPEIHARGVVEGDQAFDGVLEKVREVLEAALADGVVDTHQLQQLLRRTVGRWVSHTHRRRPMIIPVVVAT